MNNIEIPLYGEQNTILRDWLTTDKHCVDIVPVGSGKTFLAAIALPLFASDPRYHKGKDIIYSAPTGAMIKSLIWEPLKHSCINHFGLVDGKDINNSGRLIVISTPNGTGPLHDLFTLALENPEKYIVRHYNYLQMRSGNREFIEEQKRIISPLKFNQDYMCQWESVSDAFFYTWDRHKYTREIKDFGGDLWTFHDFNKRVMTAVVAQVKKQGHRDGTIEILKSYAIPDCSTEGIASAIREDFPKRRINSIIDMSGTQVNRDTTSPFGVTDRIILEKYGFTISNTRKSNPLVTDTDNTSNAFINRGGLVVSPDDKFLLEALQTYHFEDGSRKKLVKYTESRYAHIDGLGDCIRYGIHYLFPIQHESMIGIPEYVGMDSRFSSRNKPGLEHMPDSPLYPGGPTWEEIMNGDQVEDHMVWS